jgi:uncharacterized membrane protein
LEHFITKYLGRLMLVVVVGAIVALILVVTAYVCTFTGGPIAKQDVWGQFGDFMGGTLNPILSFLALLALLLTIVMQSYELRLTRQEMELSRVAQQKTEVALADQANTLREQLAEARRSANTEAFLRAVDRLQEENVRRAREVIFRLSIDDRKPFEEWTDQEKKTAEVACQSFDVVGMMIRGGMVTPDLILRSWHTTIKKSWRGTLPLVGARREKDGENFWGDYEWLYGESLKYS